MSAKKWAKEAAGQRDIMAAYGGVRAEDIRGLRAPFLSVSFCLIPGNRKFIHSITDRFDPLSGWRKPHVQNVVRHELYL